MKRAAMKHKLLTAVMLTLCLLLTSCAERAEDRVTGWESPTGKPAAGRYLTVADFETSTVDPQCTSESYLIALNVFDRLVEVRVDPDGSTEIVPSLAESWEVSEDGYIYTFRLREGVTFSNGEPLTSSDVRYTMTRLLTNPDSCNQQIASFIFGAEALRTGAVPVLAGFNIHDDHEFAITLAEPYAAFLACLSSPGASILDEETTTQAGARFGRTPAGTIGTGPFLFTEWKPNLEMTLTANPDCWSGPPRCEGVKVRVISDSESQSLLYKNGTLDILDLDNMGGDAQYYLHGDIYRDRLFQSARVGIDFIALNASVRPLDDVRVRRALQLALDRKTLLQAAADGCGTVENGIFPEGLIGHNDALSAIPYDPDEARRLLNEAGLGNGFSLEITVPKSAAQSRKELLTLVSAMWEKVGVRAELLTADDNAFLAMRKAGVLDCYLGRWDANYDDPDDFIYTFFGTEENTRTRSLCYNNAGVMERIRRARGIMDEAERMREYQALERKIVQEDAAWIPLYSTKHSFVVSERTEGFRLPWNGGSNSCYRDVAVTG